MTNPIPKPLQSAAKWAGALAAVGVLIGWVSRSSVRLHKVEEETGKVAGIEHQIKIINLYLKLQDPAMYRKAEDLAD